MATRPWQLGFGIGFVQAPFDATNGTDFVVANAPQYHHPLAYGDLDGDQDSDVCIRKSDGVWCATTDGANAFTGLSRRTTAFSDANGYDSASTGGTLMLGDVTGDGKADVCARKGGLLRQRHPLRHERRRRHVRRCRTGSENVHFLSISHPCER